jgi:long-subunit acyl-CoA synthetase (AMP-forming)
VRGWAEFELRKREFMDFKNLFDEARGHADAQLSATQVNGESRTVTFAQFLSEAAMLADRLAASGLGKNMQVGLQASNCYEYLVWDLATIRLGAILHAIPQELPPEKVAAIAESNNFALLACETPENLESVANGIALADTLSTVAFPVNQNALLLDGDDLHSRVYSSGSSGYLKGLNISRRGTEILVSDFIADFGLCVTDSHLIFLPLSNYQQRLSVYGCLWTGASFKVVHHTAVLLELGRYGPSFLVAPPTIYENIYNSFGRGADGKERLSVFLGGNIRFMITGMAPIRKELLSAFQNFGLMLLEAYGVTETGMIAWNTPQQQRIGSVGRPIHPEHVYFTDESEIIIKRESPLSTGYFDCPESEQAITFLADGSIATGDIGLLDGDGFLSLTGRKKEIIITSGGSKFHPEEVERSLSSIEAIKQAVVMMSKTDTKLVAVLVTDSGDDPDIARQIDRDIQALNASVPSYKHIHRHVVTSTMPTVDNGMLTRNLKWDRRGVYQYFQAEIELKKGMRE